MYRLPGRNFKKKANKIESNFGCKLYYNIFVYKKHSQNTYTQEQTSLQTQLQTLFHES